MNLISPQRGLKAEKRTFDAFRCSSNTRFFYLFRLLGQATYDRTKNEQNKIKDYYNFKYFSIAIMSYKCQVSNRMDFKSIQSHT